ncbi:unnamed protein product, partial [Porites lobata]
MERLDKGTSQNQNSQVMHGIDHKLLEWKTSSQSIAFASWGYEAWDLYDGDHDKITTTVWWSSQEQSSLTAVKDESTRLRDSLKGNINHQAGGHHDLPSLCSGPWYQVPSPCWQSVRVIVLVTRHSLTVARMARGQAGQLISPWCKSWV